MTDIVDDILERISTHLPDMPLLLRLKIEQETRQKWGGSDRIFIGKGINGIGKYTRTWLIAEGLRQAKALKECFAEAGVSRATGYRALAKKTSPSQNPPDK